MSQSAIFYNDFNLFLDVPKHFKFEDEDLLETLGLQKLSDFSLFKAKNAGISVGGFYHDKADAGWLLKEAHYDSPKTVVNEYLAGQLFRFFLGDNAPVTELVINDRDGTLLLGSKLLANFSTMSEIISSDHEITRTYEGGELAYLVDKKPVTDFLDGICAIQYMADTDAHFGNVGLIDHGEYYSFAKIDHGFSFSFHYQNEPLTLESFKYELNYFGIYDIASLGFEPVFSAISKIATQDFDKVENLIDTHLPRVETYLDVLGLSDLESPYEAMFTEHQSSNLSENLTIFRDNLVGHLKQQHTDFKNIADYMLLEKSIYDHNADVLSDLVSKGVSLDTLFEPFFSEDSTSGKALAQAQWPELDLDCLLNKLNGPSVMPSSPEPFNITDGQAADLEPSILMPPPLVVAPVLPEMQVVFV